MRIISAGKKLVSLCLLFGLSACSAGESTELLYLSWECERTPTSGARGMYHAFMKVYGSGDLVGTLGNGNLNGGRGIGGSGQCLDIVKKAADIAQGLGCVTRGVETTVGVPEWKHFTATCQSGRSKLIHVMGELMRYAHTFPITPFTP